jgi:YVTN family beta-propeller protein
MRLHSAVILGALCACTAARRPVPALPPLEGEGEVHVFALPFSRDAERLGFAVEAVALRPREGSDVPLQVALRDVVGGEQRDQRLLAWGRVPPGEYVGIVATVADPTLSRDGERSRLLVTPEPAFAPLTLRVDAGRAVVTWLSFDPAASMRGEHEFSPVFGATIAPQTPPQVAIYATSTAGASVTVADRRSRLVTGIIPVGESAKGVVLDQTATHAYVALPRDDQLEILDVAANVATGKIRVAPGDGPEELGLAPDGTLIVVNDRSRTVSFVDPRALTELGRVDIGDAPSDLLVDRAGRRAYVANRGSATVTVIDIANRAVAATLATDHEPVRLELSRDGSRLYVVHRGSAYLAVFRIPSLVPEPRAFVSLGVSAIRVDTRTDLVYLARGEDRRISVYDPLSLQEIDRFDVPGVVSRMVIDDADDALLALMPDRRTIAVIDLTSRKLLGEIPVGPEAHSVTLLGERR